jgi:hypothetical protein
MIPILTILVLPPSHSQSQYSSYLVTILFLCYFVSYLYTYSGSINCPNVLRISTVCIAVLWEHLETLCNNYPEYPNI